MKYAFHTRTHTNTYKIFIRAVFVCTTNARYKSIFKSAAQSIRFYCHSLLTVGHIGAVLICILILIDGMIGIGQIEQWLYHFRRKHIVFLP